MTRIVLCVVIFTAFLLSTACAKKNLQDNDLEEDRIEGTLGARFQVTIPVQVKLALFGWEDGLPAPEWDDSDPEHPTILLRSREHRFIYVNFLNTDDEWAVGRDGEENFEPVISFGIEQTILREVERSTAFERRVEEMDLPPTDHWFKITFFHEGAYMDDSIPDGTSRNPIGQEYQPRQEVQHEPRSRVVEFDPQLIDQFIDGDEDQKVQILSRVDEENRGSFFRASREREDQRLQGSRSATNALMNGVGSDLEEQYAQLQTDEQRRAFWNQLASAPNDPPPEQEVAWATSPRGLNEIFFRIRNVREEYIPSPDRFHRMDIDQQGAWLQWMFRVRRHLPELTDETLAQYLSGDTMPN